MLWHKKTVANICIEKVIMMIKQAAIDLIVALKGHTLPKQAEYAYNHLCKAISEQEKHCSWPNQPWKDLTEQESVDIAVACGCMSVDWLDLVKAVQEALKAKNTGQDTDCKRCTGGCAACDARKVTNVLP